MHDHCDDSADEGPDHHRFFGVSLDKKSRRDRHHSVGDEEGDDEQTRSPKAEGEGSEDIRHDGAVNVGEQRDDKEYEEDETHQKAVLCYVGLLLSLCKAMMPDARCADEIGVVTK